VLSGAQLYRQPALIELRHSFVARLFETGEPFSDYRRRKIRLKRTSLILSPGPAVASNFQSEAGLQS
jgi:hypothetical protein